MPWDTIRQTVEKDLGMSLAEAFASVDPTPIATASVAQVHAAGERPACAAERHPGVWRMKLCSACAPSSKQCTASADSLSHTCCNWTMQRWAEHTIFCQGGIHNTCWARNVSRGTWLRWQTCYKQES